MEEVFCLFAAVFVLSLYLYSALSCWGACVLFLVFCSACIPYSFFPCSLRKISMRRVWGDIKEGDKRSFF